MNRRLKYSGRTRNKAFLGLDESGAILAAAGIQAAATNAGAALSARAQADAASKQAKSMVEAAKTNERALRLQNDNANQLQERMLDFTKDQNAENRQQQNDIQATLQIIAGQDNTNNINESRKRGFKHGGRKRLKYQFPLQGGQPFTVTDGGTAIPLGQTSLGNLIYELYGNDHNHYHKAQGGKHKTGVGLKFKDGVTVEGEGNQNSNRGELVMIDPAGVDARFISKHTVPGTGFNPRLAIEQGMAPEDAFAYQEELKAMQGIDSEGHTIQPRRRNIPKAIFGYNPASVGNILLQTNFGQIPVANMATGIAGGVALQQDDIDKNMRYGGRYRLKRGGRCKAINGYGPNFAIQGAIKPLNIVPMTVDTSKTPAAISADIQAGTGGTGTTTTPQAPKLGAYLGAAGISALGGVLGNLITNWGNNRASGLLADAYGRAAQITADAYRQMRGIDTSAISREDYNPAHALAAIRTANYNINPQLEDVARQEREAIRQTNRSTMSSAARLNRLANIKAAGNQERSKLYALKGNEEEKIKQANNQAINTIANENANRDTEARQNFTRDYLGLLQYNNDIENSKIAGIAQAESSGILNPANIRSQNRAANASMWGNTISGIGNQFASAYDTYNKARADYNNTMFGAPLSTQMLASLPNMSDSELENLIKSLANATDTDGIFVRNRAQNLLNSRKS